MTTGKERLGSHPELSAHVTDRLEPWILFKRLKLDACPPKEPILCNPLVVPLWISFSLLGHGVGKNQISILARLDNL